MTTAAATKFDRYVNTATAKFEAGFTSKAGQKDAMDYLNRAFAILTDGARSDMLAAAALTTFDSLAERSAFIDAMGYWALPDYPHLLREKHEAMLGARWNDACMVAELRNAIKGAAIVKVERNEISQREAAVQKSIRDIMVMRNLQFERGLKIGELFANLPVHANVHLVTNQFGTTFVRAFYYLAGEMTPLNMIIHIAQELERRAEAA